MVVSNKLFFLEFSIKPERYFNVKFLAKLFAACVIFLKCRKENINCSILAPMAALNEF